MPEPAKRRHSSSSKPTFCPTESGRTGFSYPESNQQPHQLFQHHPPRAHDRSHSRDGWLSRRQWINLFDLLPGCGDKKRWTPRLSKNPRTAEQSRVASHTWSNKGHVKMAVIRQHNADAPCFRGRPRYKPALPGFAPA